MIAVVEEHNRLTGYRFVIVEYVTIGAVLGLLGGWYVAAILPLLLLAMVVTESVLDAVRRPRAA